MVENRFITLPDDQPLTEKSWDPGCEIVPTQYSGTALIRSPMGNKKIGHINEVFFVFNEKMYGGFCQAAKQKVTVMTRWPY